MDPTEVAKVILDAVTSEDPQLRYLVGNDAATRQEKICQIENSKT